jgi:Tfp pilus assembly protein PilN
VWWVVAIAWGAALIVAAVVLGSCLYELSWKSARLRKDVALLTEAEAELAGLQARIRAAQERLAIVRLER